jgi:hypothetical protein
MAQKKKTKKTAVRRKSSRNKQKAESVLVTQDRASQEKLAQVVVDTIKDRQAAQEAPVSDQAESGQLNDILEYLENTILPRARNSFFMVWSR